MIQKKFHKIILFILLASGLVGVAFLTGSDVGGVTAEFQPESASVPDGWTVECVDCLRYFGEMSGNSAALDSNGRIHTAYGGDSLYYAVEQNDDSYQTEVVDNNSWRGMNATMVLDSSDRPHILYYAGDLLRLNYAYFDGVSWQITSLPTADLTDLPHPWLVIDSGDNLHLSFTSGDDLLYGFFDGLNWQIETVDTDGTGDIGRSSLDLDSNERPHVAYAGGQRYAYFDGTDWQITTFAGTFTGQDIVLALDASDRPHIAYQSDINGQEGLDLRYRFYDGANWQVEDVEESVSGALSEVGYDISLTFDATNEPIIAYTNRFFINPYPTFEFYVVRLARRDQTGWQMSNISEEFVAVEDKNYATMLSGSGSDLIFVYKESNEMKSAVLQNDYLTATTIDEGGKSGTHIDMMVDSEDNLHISANEPELPRLRYATNSQGDWVAETLHIGAGFVGSKWTSMALTSDNRPFILFDHYTRLGGMPYVYLEDNNWIYDLNESQNSFNFDVAMDSADNFHIANLSSSYLYPYLDHIVRNSSGDWENVAVDGPIVQNEVRIDITIDSADFPHIAYPAPNGLRYAVETPSGWLTETVITGMIDYPSLALDRLERPHIAWYDKSAGDLRYAAFDGEMWQIETVDSNGDVGQYASLAVDRIGRIYIAYYDASNGDLKYATNDGSGWSIETLLSDGDVGSFSKLVMPYAGYPAIAYYDAVSRDLMLIYRPFSPTNFAYSPIFESAGP